MYVVALVAGTVVSAVLLGVFIAISTVGIIRSKNANKYG